MLDKSHVASSELPKVEPDFLGFSLNDSAIDGKVASVNKGTIARRFSYLPISSFFEANAKLSIGLYISENLISKWIYKTSSLPLLDGFSKSDDSPLGLTLLSEDVNFSLDDRVLICTNGNYNTMYQQLLLWADREVDCFS